MDIQTIIEYTLRTPQNVNPNVLRSMLHQLERESGVRFIIVDELPEVGEANVVYLLAAYDPDEGDIYEEYVWVADTQTYEKLGHAKRITIDDALSTTSHNPVENRVITTALEDVGNTLSSLVETVNGKQDTLVSGQNIKTLNGMSLVGGGQITLDYVPSNRTIAGLSLSNNITKASLQTALNWDSKLNSVNPVVLGTTTSGTTNIEMRFVSDIPAASNLQISETQGTSSVALTIRQYADNYNRAGRIIQGISNWSDHTGHVHVSDPNFLLHLASSDTIMFVKQGSGVGYILDTFNTSANPTLAGTEATLTSLKLNDVSYKIPTFDPTTIAGYDASKSQILTHNQGTLAWIDSAATQSGNEVTLP